MNRLFDRLAVSGEMILTFSLALAVLSGCAFNDDPEGASSPPSAAHSHAIIGGIPTDDWPAVGALVIEGEYVDGDLTQFCSGTLIDPEWVLTAGHCVVVSMPTQQGGEIEVTPEMVSFFIGPNVLGEGELYEFDAFYPYPDFIPGAPIIRDVALAHLTSRVPAEVAEPIAINYERVNTSWEGREITWVGYGVNNGSLQTGNGIKRYGTGTIEYILVDMLGYLMSEDGQLPCNGDSGGASLYDDEGVIRVIGITHMGDQGCTNAGLDTRVDPFTDWIDELLATTRPPCAITGGDCDAGSACQAVEDRLECQPAGTLEPGDPCEVAAESWPPYPCGDGSSCLDIAVEDGGIGPACYANCTDDVSCADTETCLIGAHPGSDDLGACVCRDDDADGYCQDVDCNDADAAIHPGATEVCGDGLDNNCDSLIDRADTAACPTPARDDDDGCSVAGELTSTSPRGLLLFLVFGFMAALARRPAIRSVHPRP